MSRVSVACARSEMICAIGLPPASARLRFATAVSSKLFTRAGSFTRRLACGSSASVMPISAFRSASRAFAAASSSGVDPLSTSAVAPPAPAISTAARRMVAARRVLARCTSRSLCSSLPFSARSVGSTGVIVSHGARRSISFAKRAAARCQNDVDVAARSRHERSTVGSAALRCSARSRASARAASRAACTASLVR